jgi:hypothetical protein
MEWKLVKWGRSFDRSNGRRHEKRLAEREGGMVM